MRRGDWVVRFWTEGPGSRDGHVRLGSSVHRDVQPVLHSSGVLEITEVPDDPQGHRGLVVAYGPGAWQSITPADPPHTHRVSGPTVASAEQDDGW